MIRSLHYNDATGRIQAVDPGMVNVRDFGAVGDGSTDDTAAIAAAFTAAAGRPLFLPLGTYLVTALPALTDLDRLVGAGYESEILYAGTGTLLTLTGKQDIAFESLSIHLTGAGAIALDLSGCFQISLQGVRIRGEHTGATGTTYHGQIGIKLRDNTGNTRVHDCLLANLGAAVESRCIQNELTNSKIVNSYIGVRGVDNAAANAGLVCVACEFIGDTDPDTVAAHVNITGRANAWHFTGCWFEGSEYGLIVGVFGTGGPSSFTMFGCKIAARVVGLQFNNCRQPTLIGCEFNLDSGGTMTEIAYGGTPAGDEVIEGLALNLVTTLRSDFNDSDFPQYWIVQRRGQLRAPNFTSSSNVTVDGTTDTGNIKVRNGSAAGRVLVSDADGDGTWTAPDDLGLTEGLQWWQTYTLHAVGVGQQDMGIHVPFDCYIEKYRFRIATAGTGGSLAAELRKNGTAGGDIIGASQTPSTSPSWTTPTAPGLSLAADDLLWCYVTAINSTTVGSQLKVELLLRRR